MNVAGPNETEERMENILPLFDSVEIPLDPIQEMLSEGDSLSYDDDFFESDRELVTEGEFPDQSIYILERQLKNLNESLNRIKFYLGDIDDLLPK